MQKEIQVSLNNIAKPRLEERGFIHNGAGQFIKERENGHDLVIEFQSGKKYLKGKFTVNLICGNKLVRLNMIRPTFLSKVLNKLLGEKETWWKGIFLPKDKWWDINPDQEKTDAIVKKIVTDLESFGIKHLKNM